MIVRNVSATELRPVMSAELPGNRREIWLNQNISKEHDENGNDIWTADTVHFVTAMSVQEITERFDEIWDEKTAPAPTITDLVDGLNALAEMIMM